LLVVAAFIIIRELGILIIDYSSTAPSQPGLRQNRKKRAVNISC
jgi:hypothetical protein